MLTGRSEDALHQTKNDILSDVVGVPADAIMVAAIDVADSDAVAGAAEQCESQLGPIDIWVNNAMATVFSPAWDLGCD